MYFFDFESYKQVADSAKSVTIVVTRTDGEMVKSSPIPLAAYATVMEAIVHCQDTRTPLMIWERITSGLIVGPSFPRIIIIPFEQIRSIDLVFAVDLVKT